MVQDLGQDGMSSDDEADSEQALRRVGKPPLYIARKVPWRSFEVEMVLRSLDEVHRRRRIGTRGAHPRIRNLSEARESRRTPVNGLPKNYYSRSWYEGLRRAEKEELLADDERDIIMD